MNTLVNLFKRIYIRTTGYSYTHLGRLFLRLFVGIMLMQFGVRAICGDPGPYPCTLSFPGSDSASMPVAVSVMSIVCSLFIMVGILTRLMILPPLVIMLTAACWLIYHAPLAPYELPWWYPAFMPVMFAGIYMFLLLVGPGKISFDYFIALHFIHSDNQSESELEEV